MTKDEALKPELTCVCGAVWDGDALVQAPRKREWKGLTLDEIRLEYGRVSPNAEWAIGGLSDVCAFYRAIEFKLKEKNT